MAQLVLAKWRDIYIYMLYGSGDNIVECGAKNCRKYEDIFWAKSFRDYLKDVTTWSDKLARHIYGAEMT